MPAGNPVFYVNILEASLLRSFHVTLIALLKLQLFAF